MTEYFDKWIVALDAQANKEPKSAECDYQEWLGFCAWWLGAEGSAYSAQPEDVYPFVYLDESGSLAVDEEAFAEYLEDGSEMRGRDE